MKKYVQKNLSDVPVIQGFSTVESALFSENGMFDIKKIEENFPDLKTKSWLSRFINEISPLSMGPKFRKFIEDNKSSVFCVIGDYDADGIMATTIMKLALQTFGVKRCDYVIPDRLNDGYGIKQKHVDRAISTGAQVIVTVDNGITANEAIEYAKSKGLKVVVTDHHIPDKNNLPKADLLINPHLTNESFEEICGAMVAFKLATSLIDSSIRENEYVLKDLALFAAVATISDVMPILSENRLLVKYVLDNVNFVKDKGLWAGRTLKFISGFGNTRLVKNEEQVITEDTIAFYIGPAINASGRVSGETEHVVEDIINAASYNVFINGYREINNERKTKTQEIFREHVVNAEEPIGFMIIDHEKYDYPIGGLIGLVANRIADREQKPALIGTLKDGKISFSCRSVPGYSLYGGLKRFFEKHPNTQVQGGGHDGAIGIRTSSDEDIKLLKEHFIQDYQQYAGVMEETVFKYDKKYAQEVFDSHSKLAPFGKGFERLKFVYEGEVMHVDPTDYTIQIGDTMFRAFSKEQISQNVGARVRVIFSVVLDNKKFDDFKIDEIEVI